MITPSETLQLNELLNIKCLSLSKSLLMSPMVSDSNLKEILAKEAEICEGHIKELQSYMEQSTVRCESSVEPSSESGVIQS